MKYEYRKELIQVAAVALAIAQLDETGSTCRISGPGYIAEAELLDAVKQERRRQEDKWGPRSRDKTTPAWWLAVLMEEVGEVAEEVAKTGHGAVHPLVQQIIDAGQAARAELEK